MFETQIPSDRRDDIERSKNTYLNMSQNQLILRIRDLKQSKKDFEEDLRAVNLELQAITEAAHELFEEWKIETIRTSDGYLSTGHDIYCSVTDRDRAIHWLRRNELENILKFDFSWQTLNAVIKERAQNGLNLPEELNGIKIYLKPKITFRK